MVHETSPFDKLPMSPATLRVERSKLQKGMSIVDFDVDLEEDNGAKRKASQMEVQ